LSGPLLIRPMVVRPVRAVAGEGKVVEPVVQAVEL
jgi:hypothetical protein